MSHNDDTPDHGDIEHYDDDEVNPNVDGDDDDQAEGSECNITSDDLDQIAVGYSKKRIWSIPSRRSTPRSIVIASK
jgi:hypothetical protein